MFCFYVALLEEKLDDITKEAELSNIGTTIIPRNAKYVLIRCYLCIGQDQLDNLRAAVAQKAKENRYNLYVTVIYGIC